MIVVLDPPIESLHHFVTTSLLLKAFQLNEKTQCAILQFSEELIKRNFFSLQ